MLKKYSPLHFPLGGNYDKPGNKKDRPTFAEAAQGLTTPIISYADDKSSIVSVISEARKVYLACPEDVERVQNELL